METETQPLKSLRISENKRKILVAIAQSPRKLRSFSHGEVTFQMHPDVISGWLKELQDHGLIYEAESSYHITVKGRQRLDAGKQEEYRVASLRNVITQGKYTGEPRDYQRPNSCTKHIPSKGQSC